MNENKLFKKLKEAIEDKDEFKVTIISTLLHNLGVPIHDFSYDSYTGDFLICVDDTSDTTFAWSESSTFYNPHDDVTYCICEDQDGGSEVVWSEDGLVY